MNHPTGCLPCLTSTLPPRHLLNLPNRLLTFKSSSQGLLLREATRHHLKVLLNITFVFSSDPLLLPVKGHSSLFPGSYLPQEHFSCTQVNLYACPGGPSSLGTLWGQILPFLCLYALSLEWCLAWNRHLINFLPKSQQLKCND